MGKVKNEERLKAWEWFVILFGLTQGFFLLVLLAFFFVVQHNPDLLLELGVRDLVAKNLMAAK